MKFSVAVIIAFAASFVSAQLDGLPPCATNCVTKGLSSTACAVSSLECICKNEDFIKNINSCIQTACSEADQKKTITFAKKLCASVGAAIPSSLISSLTTQGSASAGNTPSATMTGSGATASTSSAANKLVPGLGLGAAAAALLLL